MKKYSLFLLCLLGIFVTACDNELPDELFTKRVVISQNGFQEMKLEYSADGKVSTHVTISISGTSVLDHDIIATITECPDTLEAYNYDKYSDNEELYYTLLPKEAYKLGNSGKVTIKGGEEYTLLPIEFDLSQLDMYKDYVLPLEVSAVSDYEIGQSSYRRALYHLTIRNLFSYTYSPSGCKIWNSDEGDDYTTWTTDMVLSTIDYNTCRMYAGGVNDTDKDRNEYLVEVTMEADSTFSYTSPNPDIDLEKVGGEEENRIRVTEEPDLLVNNKFVITTTMKMNYRYTYTSPEGYPYRRRFEGTLSNSRTVFRDKDGNIREEK